MDLGLGNLTELKAHLLNEALRSQSTYDAALAALGRGVASRFETFCDRKFARLAGDTFECDADQSLVSLPRYPVESITAIAVRDDLATGYVDQGTPSSQIYNLREKSGLVEFAAAFGISSSRLKLTYTGGLWYQTRATRTIQQGTVAFASGARTAFVAFDTAFAALPLVACGLQPADGGQVIAITAQDVTTAGFTLVLAAAAPASGYVGTWVATDPADGENDTTVLKVGNSALAIGAESLAVAFAAAFSAAPIVLCNVIAPDGGIIISAQPSVVTAAGFTAQLGFPIPAAGYSLAWLALAQGATAVAADTIPVGATALPYDLKYAWLLQCEHVWGARDALGLSLAKDKAGVSPELAGMSRLALVPEVEATLRDYRRHVIA